MVSAKQGVRLLFRDAETFFSELEGNELMKKALCCALFSTPEEPVCVLVVGDPAGGKTLAKDIIAGKLGPEIELIGANTTLTLFINWGMQAFCLIKK